ncbi:nucleotidyltransferase domain-containing protein [Halobacillus sp. ACCC02827]|uniref:nucleotidyltransferase domain-containing protein n=1 Tax=Halobacillus sp. ACCC02827 TaxID=3052090 RepID=UPI0033652BE8
MALSKRLEPLEAVKRIIDERFPACDAAIVAGSVIRGEGTATSDLDIVLFERERQASYRTSFFAYGWPMEVFVHSFLSYENYFESDREGGQPSLQQMVSEGDRAGCP